MRANLIAAAAVLLMISSTARAEDEDSCAAGQVCASDPDSVMRAMEKAGLDPKRTADDRGNPMIESDAAPYHFDILFRGCAGAAKCDSLRFEVSFAKAPENGIALANKWNAGNRFLYAHVAEDGRLVAAYDLATIGGVNDRNFADLLEWWKTKLGDLAAFFAREVPEG